MWEIGALLIIAMDLGIIAEVLAFINDFGIEEALIHWAVLLIT